VRYEGRAPSSARAPPPTSRPSNAPMNALARPPWLLLFYFLWSAARARYFVILLIPFGLLASRLEALSVWRPHSIQFLQFNSRQFLDPASERAGANTREAVILSRSV
jgi:hypothetical protein